MARRLLEKSVEQKVVAAAKRLGIKIILKLELRTNAGFPDRVFLAPGGKAIFIEFKSEGKRPRPLQLFRLRKLREQGYDAAWFDNAPDAIRYLTGAMGAAPGTKKGGQVPS